MTDTDRFDELLADVMYQRAARAPLPSQAVTGSRLARRSRQRSQVAAAAIATTGVLAVGGAVPALLHGPSTTPVATPLATQTTVTRPADCPRASVPGTYDNAPPQTPVAALAQPSLLAKDLDGAWAPSPVLVGDDARVWAGVLSRVPGAAIASLRSESFQRDAPAVLQINVTTARYSTATEAEAAQRYALIDTACANLPDTVQLLAELGTGDTRSLVTFAQDRANTNAGADPWLLLVRSGPDLAYVSVHSPSQLKELGQNSPNTATLVTLAQTITTRLAGDEPHQIVAFRAS